MWAWSSYLTSQAAWGRWDRTGQCLKMLRGFPQEAVEPVVAPTRSLGAESAALGDGGRTAGVLQVPAGMRGQAQDGAAQGHATFRARAAGKWGVSRTGSA